MSQINPYYNPEDLGLESISFDEPDMSYEYNTLCFWKTKDGRIYSASDSGCSYHTPFDQFSGSTLDEVLQLLERVGSVGQAEAIFTAWNDSIYQKQNRLPIEDKNNLSNWVKANLKA